MKNKIISLECYDSTVGVVWDNGSTDYLSTQLLRRYCPCAFCSGEKDVFGKVYKGPEQSLSKEALQVSSFSFIGHYGIKIVWKDSHSDGIFTFELFKKLIALSENK